MVGNVELRALFERSATLARLVGNEVAIIMPGMMPRTIVKRAEDIVRALAQPLAIDGQHVL